MAGRVESRGSEPGPTDRVRAALLDLLRWLGAYLRGFYALAGVLLSAGLLGALAALWGLSILTEDVLEGDTIRFDRASLLWLNQRATPWLDAAAVRVTALGDTLVVLTLAAVAGAILWVVRRRAYAALLAIAICGAAILNTALKAVFDRPRPRLFEWRVHFADSSSYPSGHATMSMVTLVVLAYILHRLADRPWLGLGAMLLAGLLTLLIGASRLYLGVHYPSDVIAGYAVGFAWAVFCTLAVEALRHQRGSPTTEPRVAVRSRAPIDPRPERPEEAT